METCQKPLSQKEIAKKLSYILKSKGYPSELLHREIKLSFSFGNLYYEIFLPVIVKKEQTLLLTYYNPSLNGLSCFERPLLSIARLFFDPLPYFAILTNLQIFTRIELYPQRLIKGSEEIIPSLEELLNYKADFTKPFKRELEEKILALYISGG